VFTKKPKGVTAKKAITPYFITGAEGETRTPTRIPPLDPESFSGISCNLIGYHNNLKLFEK
jgi:hypothetical protein